MRLLAGKSAKVWKYELLASGGWPGDFVLLRTSEFKAANLADAKSILAGVVTNIKARGSVKPNAIRLIDPDGDEIWRALITGPRPAVRRPANTGRHPRLLAHRKGWHY